MRDMVVGVMRARIGLRCRPVASRRRADLRHRWGWRWLWRRISAASVLGAVLHLGL